jgi:LuxR family maltose regulon positive regulatory protein
MVSAPTSRDQPPGTRAWIEAARGELRRSEDLAHAVLDDADAGPEAAAGAHLALGMVARARGDLDEAGAELATALAAADRVHRSGLATIVRLEHALVASSAGDHLGAIGTVVDVDRRLPGRHRTTFLADVVVGVDAFVHLAAGDRDRAEVLADRLPEGPHRTLLTALVALERGRVEEARDAVAAVLAEDGLDRRLRTDALILASRAEEAAGHHEAARRHREEVAALTVPEGNVRAYLDLGVAPPGPVGRPAVRPVPAGPPLALSAKELQVLRHLVERLDNREIGAALYISVNTVKTHLQSLYRKLGVESRRQAVERARELGLL